MNRIKDALNRNSGVAALVVAVIALVVATAGVSTAVTSKSPSTKPRKYGLLLLGKNKKFPAKAIPKVAKARSADRLGGRRLVDLNDGCAADSVDMGTYCIMSSPFPIDNVDEGKNNYFYATKKCAEFGGWLPTAGELLGAVDRIKIASTADDSATTASVDEDPTDGLKDRREMTSSLVTTASGSAAAGSQGVSSVATGQGNGGEGDPVPMQPNPQPETLQYITVYDNKDQGGFAGSKPVAQPERFRCAFSESQRRAQRKIAE